MATHLTVALMLLVGSAPSPVPAGDPASPTSQTPPPAGMHDAPTPPAGASDAATPPPGTAATSDAYAKPPTQGPGDAVPAEPPQAPAVAPPPAAASPVPPESALSPTPPPSAANEAGNDTISLDDWRRDDWMLVKPKVSMVEIDGYFRLRGDLLRHMDFDNRVNWEQGTVPRYQALSDGHADFSSTNMRLRVEPRINITEQLQVISTVDLLDNLVLGSTPDSLYVNTPYRPVDILSFGQLPPQQGVNSLTNSIVVKRLWARMTALNEQLELRIGRMPDHFGLGLLYNNGDCLDCDYGLSVDRISLAVRAFDHVFMPMIDWVGRGPQVRPFGTHDPAPIDALSADDTMQYALRVMREDHPDDIRDAVNHGRRVVNYGLSNAFRWQAHYYSPALYPNSVPPGLFDPAVEPSADLINPTPTERRDAFLYVGDVYAKYYFGLFELASEVAVQAGTFSDAAINQQLMQTSVFKLGGAFEGRYRTRPDGMGIQLSLKGGAASGDGRQGFGALDRADTQRGGTDTNLHNFQFSPDYHIDLLMFRRMIGAVTDAWYVRPEVAYRFDDKVMGRVNAVYSQAVNGKSTPSATAGSSSTPMGLEFDAELMYGSEARRQEAQLMASLAGGILFPLGAFNNPQSTQGNSFAWTIQARVYLTF